MDHVHQLIYSIIVTKNTSNKVIRCIDPWGEILKYIAWTTRAYFHRILKTKLGQAVYGRDMIFNLSKVLDWQVITTYKQGQVGIDNDLEKRQASQI